MMAEIAVTYDGVADAGYAYFVDPKLIPYLRVARVHACDPTEVGGMINLDFDDGDCLVGIEVLGASAKFPRFLLDGADRIDRDVPRLEAAGATMVHRITSFEIEIRPVDGSGPDGSDTVSLEFKGTDASGRTLQFAVIKDETASIDAAEVVVDPQSGSIPLPVVEWAVGYARAHL